MSSLQTFRQFFDERLSAAAEEIFRVFEKTVLEYEGEISRQRKLLDSVGKLQTPFNVLEHNVSEEDFVIVQLPSKQKKSSSLDQEHSEAPQIKDEQVEFSIELDGDELLLHREMESAPVTFSDDQRGDTEGQILSRDEYQALLNGSSLERNEVPETISDSQVLYNDSGTKYHFCKVCGERFTRATSLTKHMRIHPHEKLYSCDLCPKKFSTLSGLISHKRIHTHDNPYVCKVCGKSCLNVSQLSAHMKSHTGEKPFSCKICGRAFSMRGNLNRHIKCHRDEKAYSCDTCGEEFSHRSNLKDHLKIHPLELGHTCDTCGKDFKLGSDLIDHMRTHAGDRPYFCITCGRGFSQLQHLQRHKKTHR